MEKEVDAIDTELFINEIEKCPAIWNTSSDEYSDKVAKKNAWMSVMKTFFVDFDYKTPAEKKQVASLIQKKWKNLRDSFSRELKKQREEHKSGAGVSSRKTYIFFEQLKFLHVAVKKTSSSIVPEGDESKTSENASDQEEELEDSNFIPKKKKKRGSTCAQEDDLLIKHLKTKILQKNDSQETDADKLFLLSLASNLKSIPDHMKLDVKTKLMTVLNQAKQAAFSHNQRSNLNAYGDTYPRSNYPPPGPSAAARENPYQYGYPAGQHQGNPPNICTLPAFQVNVPVTVAPTFQPRIPTSTLTELQPMHPMTSFEQSTPTTERSVTPSDSELDFNF